MGHDERWKESSLGKFSRTVDKHRWVGEEECQTCKHVEAGRTHLVTCADCGIRRTHYAENGAFNFWVYTCTDGSCNELIPLCGAKQPDPAKGEMFDIIRVCAHCGHCLKTDYEGGPGVCHYLAKELAEPAPPETPRDAIHKRILESRAEALVRHRDAGIKVHKVVIGPPRW